MKLVFDIETTGLLWEADRIWIICTHDLDTKEDRFYSDVDPEAHGTIEEGIDYIYSADVLIAHNGIGYDKLVIEKLTGRKFHGVFRDSMIMSQVLNYKRFNGRHSLAVWGEFFGVPKPEHEDWSQYSPEMRVRCQEDVKINVLVWERLIKELKSRKDPEKLKIGLESEHKVAEFCAQAELYGWPFDKEKAEEILRQLEEKIQEAKEIIEPNLRLKVKGVDASGEVRQPRFNKDGKYAAASVAWLDIDPVEGLKELHERPYWGPCTRVEAIQPDIGSLESVKELLYENGWTPTEWNWKRGKDGKLIKTTPKLTEDSLIPLGKIGEIINEFYALRARHSILQSWVDSLDQNNRLHGNCFTIGTPTYRARHSIIANIPSVNATFGPEIRSCFTCDPGYKIVGADSSGNQLRGLCHYAEDPNLTKEVNEGDIHTFNGTIIEMVYGSLEGKARAIAKTFIYAFLYAGGDGKLGLIVSGKRDAELGKKLRAAFMKRIPGLGALIKKIEKQWEFTFNKTGKGYIMGLDGRFVYAEQKRLSLNYLLQSCEKITCSLAVMWAMEKLEAEGIWYQPLIMYHDEIEIMVREEDAERAAEICKTAFREGPKLLGVTNMDGESKIGTDWLQVH